ncbi:F1F0 ATP synthase subunit H [Martiniozyma asiatica (nom. inval.)]|nr:F1F0 ATP synthase subunit H [Martiniozyma asiatica]
MFRQVRTFASSLARSNLIADLYVSELRAFKPTPLTAADAQAATKPWKLPTAAKLPTLEGEGADALASYESQAVEVTKGEGSAQEYKADDWFVFEEDVEPGHAHH